MTVSDWTYLLPVVFAAHNIEECLGMERWTKAASWAWIPPVTTRQFSIAAGLFTVLGGVVVWTKPLYPLQEYYTLAVTAFSGMMLLNVFFPHVLLTVVQRKYMPGVITAVSLNAPVTVHILWSTWQAGTLTGSQFAGAVAAGGFIGLVLAVALLRLGGTLDGWWSRRA